MQYTYVSVCACVRACVNTYANKVNQYFRRNVLQNVYRCWLKNIDCQYLHTQQNLCLLIESSVCSKQIYLENPSTIFE